MEQSSHMSNISFASPNKWPRYGIYRHGDEVDEEEAQTAAHSRPSCRARAHRVSWARVHEGPVGTVYARAHGHIPCPRDPRAHGPNLPCAHGPYRMDGCELLFGPPLHPLRPHAYIFRT